MVEVCSKKVSREAVEDFLVCACLYLFKYTNLNGVGDFVRYCWNRQIKCVEVNVTYCAKQMGSTRGCNEHAQVPFYGRGMGARWLVCVTSAVWHAYLSWGVVLTTGSVSNEVYRQPRVFGKFGLSNSACIIYNRRMCKHCTLSCVQTAYHQLWTMENE